MVFLVSKHVTSFGRASCLSFLSMYSLQQLDDQFLSSVLLSDADAL
jgi:uncharacterized membrane protein